MPGAILSQYKDQRLHLVAYVSTAEANYEVTSYRLGNINSREQSHTFLYYLCAHDVAIITDHSVVKAILRAPNLMADGGARFMESTQHNTLFW